MNKALLSGVIITFLFITSCGQEESKKVYSTGKGKVEVTRKGDGETRELTVKTEEGTATMKMGGDFTAQDLGVPIYPNVEKVEGGTWSMTGMQKEGAKGLSSTVLFTKDPIDQVSSFYKEALEGEKTELFEMNMPTGKMVSINLAEEGVNTNVVLTENRDKGGTNIQITKAGE
jgi:hypothetical protein